MPINKPKITPGQGLLLLIEYYQDDSQKLNQLKKLYLSGAKDGDRCIAICDALLDEPLLKHYDLAIDEKSIDADPSRRYFETHLAYQTLKHHLSHIAIQDIYNLYLAISSLVDLQNVTHEDLNTINLVLRGEYVRPSFKRRENYEYGFYLKRLKNGSVYPEFSASKREKIKWIERVVYMGLVNGWKYTNMPLDIYYTARFGSSERGRVDLIDDQRTTRNQSFGLLKGHMPLSADDIAVSSSTFAHIKPADYATFDQDSEVVQACFQQLVHPFSNSISGCFLLQLRVLARLHNDEQTVVTESLDAFTQWLRLSISSSLYYSGGHSLYEFAAVLALPEVQTFFQYMPGFSELDLDTLFYHGNELAFDEALAATLKYNGRLLKKQALHRELCESRDSFFGSAALKKCHSPVTVSPLDVAEIHTYLEGMTNSH